MAEWSGLKTGRKHCGKRRNCSSRAISLFSTVFSKDMYCRQVKTRACLGKDSTLRFMKGCKSPFFFHYYFVNSYTFCYNPEKYALQ